MGWVSLLEAVAALHANGMGVSRALATHARTAAGASQSLAAAWVILRARQGDPAVAMRALGRAARTRRDRLVADTLEQCLRHPGADHGELMARALQRLAIDGPEERRSAGRRLGTACRRLDPCGRTRLRQ
ncbi:MAG: hypothetical protein NVSMB48_19200 [Marmoricola sp.]